MNNKIFAVVAAVVLMAMPIYARKATKEYLRPSLHMVLMTSNEEATEGTVAISDPEILGYASQSWDNYTFPALYNDFRVETTQMSIDKAKGSIMDLLQMYSDSAAFEGLTIDQLKTIVEMTKGKAYLDSLKLEVDKVSNQIAHELVRKWWCIQDDGSFSDSLIIRLSCYAATQNQVRDITQTTLGSSADKQIYGELMNEVMANTFVTFTKLDFYENEPIAKFIQNIMLLVANQTPSPANAAVVLAANKAYDASREGYTAFANALLYQLQWDDAKAEEFFAIWQKDGKIDMEKFNAMPFELKFCGSTKANATCMMKKEDRGKDAAAMVAKTIHKALDRQFVDMQMAYEEFRPMVPVLGLDAKGGVIADMGTKEGVKVGDKFNLLEPYVNEKGILKYKLIGTISVVKWSGDGFVNGVWDNQSQDNVETIVTEEGTDMDIIGTHLKKFKNATPSMFVKRTKK